LVTTNHESRITKPGEGFVRPYSIGDRVSQQQYGAGTVTAVNEYHTVIDFDEHGTRTFATAMVQLERSSTTAPVRVKGARRKKAAPTMKTTGKV
jgi:hypothetical protein